MTSRWKPPSARSPVLWLAGNVVVVFALGLVFLFGAYNTDSGHWVVERLPDGPFRLARGWLGAPDGEAAEDADALVLLVLAVLNAGIAVAFVHWIYCLTHRPLR